jgi:tetratricopeptide (TPR) repeat protein
MAMAFFMIGVCWIPEVEAGKNGWEEIFFEANKSYSDGLFQEAIRGYESLIRSGLESGHLYYNLGNAYLRAEQLGEAIVNYERAHLFMPRDADLNFNLSYARDQMQDAIPQSPGFLRTAFFWLDSLSMAELFKGFALINILFWGILFLRLFHRKEWTYYFFLIFLIFWLIGGVSFGLKWYQRGTDDRAVIIQEEVNILAGPDVKDTVLFKLHEGSILHYERSEDGWSLVHLPDGKRGWLKSKDIQLISLRHHAKTGSPDPAQGS